MGMFGLPIAPGLTWPVVDPGGLVPWTEFDNPAALPVEFDNPAALPADPPAPAACARAIELESANAPANTIVANFMGRFPLASCTGITREARVMFPHLLMNMTCDYLASVGKILIRHRFQMRSMTAKLVWSAFTPSPGVR
jgi:hypothetical protein